MKMWKDVLTPATFAVPDPSDPAKRRVVQFKPGDIANACQQGLAMLKAGRYVPGCWEHQDYVSLSHAERAAEKAKNVYGWVSAFKVKDGRLQVQLSDISRHDRARLKKCRFVSPRMFYDFVDGTGRKWPGWTVQHVAATPFPVQQRQNKFDLSHASGPPPACVDLGHGVLLGEPMAEESTPTPEKTDDAPSPKEGSGGEAGKLAKIIAKLKTCEIHLGDDAHGGMEFEEFLSRLDAALDTFAAHAMDDDDDDDEGDPNDPNNVAVDSTAQAATPPPVTMSFGADSNDMAAKVARRQLLAEVERRKSRLGGHYDKAKRLAQTVDLSLSADGDILDNPLTVMLDVIDANRPSKVKLPSRSGKRVGRSFPTSADLSQGGAQVQTPPDYLSAEDEVKRQVELERRATERAERLSIKRK